MKPNINNKDFQATKKILNTNNISKNSIDALDKALKNGFVFTESKDLDVLNIPLNEAIIIKGIFDFSPLPIDVINNNIQRFEFVFEPNPKEENLYGFLLGCSYPNMNGLTVEESYPINDGRRVIFELDLSIIQKGIAFFVKNSRGEKITFKEKSDSDTTFKESISYDKSALKNQIYIINTSIRNKESVYITIPTYRIKGKLICNNSQTKLDGYDIVVFANTTGGTSDNDYFPICFARTETNGYFITNFLEFPKPEDINSIKFAKAKIIKDNTVEVNIRLESNTIQEDENVKLISRIPEKLILFLESNAKSDDCDCGCGSLNFQEKKVLREQSYFYIVRTTEPSVEAIELEEEEEIDISNIIPNIPGIKNVPRNVLAKAYQKTKLSGLLKTNFSSPEPTASKPLLDIDILKKLIEQNNLEKALKKQKRTLKGRVLLDALNSIDWDETATIYQATSIAHGHILQYKQEWTADGYSLGDILYSLPLAPGQKKQIAIVDFDRTERASNSQSLTFEERLRNTLIHDRDIDEVVTGVLKENITSSSEADTGGVGLGLGLSVLGSIGSVFGISGGSSSSSSTATQNALRESTATSSQKLLDKTIQSANAVRSQRATVVQTVAQGERSEAIAESVANYNHCHAITIQYFEVLRHFLVQTRLADVKECLFIPLKMSQFDIEKTLRWRNILYKRLLNRSLRPAFDALERIQNEEESATENYYDSIGYPKNIYAEEELVFLEGELYLEFLFMTPLEVKAELIKKFQKFGISGLLIDTAPSDEEFAKNAGPILAQKVLDYIQIECIIKGNSNIENLPIELTLISPFKHKKRLYVSIRLTDDISTKKIKRQDIKSIRLNLGADKSNDPNFQDFLDLYQKHVRVMVRSGAMRYRTKSLSETLFSSSRIDNDIVAGDDGILISTALLNSKEMKNPRAEDVDMANKLIKHLNEHIVFYNKCLLWEMDPDMRYMFLDGIIAPGKGNGRSVASVVENKVIGIAGNSLIMPVASGNQLDPTIDEDFNLFAQYFNDSADPIRISLPTKGVYAEAVIGKCNSCEEKDESRFWRWEESPIPDSPQTQIAPLSTESRRADTGNLQPKDFANPIVNIQNAPSAPDPSGLQGLIQLLSKGDSFRDLTGLNQNQLNALSAFQSSLQSAQAFGKEAADLAKEAGKLDLQKSMTKDYDKTIKAIRNSNLPPEKKAELEEKALNALIGGGAESSIEEPIELEKGIKILNSLKEQGILSDNEVNAIAKKMTEKHAGVFESESGVEKFTKLSNALKNSGTAKTVKMKESNLDGSGSEISFETLSPHVIQADPDTVPTQIIKKITDLQQKSKGSGIYIDTYRVYGEIIFSNFDVNKSDMKDDFLPALDLIANILNSSDDVSITLIGRSSQTGSEKWNKDLSEMRWETIFNDLHGQKLVDRYKFIDLYGVGSLFPLVHKQGKEEPLNRSVSLIFDVAFNPSKPIINTPPSTKVNGTKNWSIRISLSGSIGAVMVGAGFIAEIKNRDTGVIKQGYYFAGGIGAGLSTPGATPPQFNSWSDFMTKGNYTFDDFDGVFCRFSTFGVGFLLGYSKSYVSFPTLGVDSVGVGGINLGSIGVSGDTSFGYFWF